jgi:RNA:NAD 2'-phosphotransferase (TPT1/KptA family)
LALAPERLSRFLTFLLRHKPKDYSLTIDREGFAPWPEVVDVVQERFYDVSEEQIRLLIAAGQVRALHRTMTKTEYDRR